MSNKTQLQLNNETLASILSNVLGLPSQESLKHGAYVWKKYELGFEEYVEYTHSSGTSEYGTGYSVPLTIYGGTSYTFDPTTAIYTLGGDITSYTVEATGANPSSVGNSCGYEPYYIVGGTSGDKLIKTTSNSTLKASVYNGTLYLYRGDYFYICGSKSTHVFADFVVSDSPTTYPDGGEQGGYWYEKVVDGVALLSMYDCTKLAIDSFVLASNTKAYGYIVSHSLGEKPKYALLYPNAVPSTVNEIAFCLMDKEDWSTEYYSSNNFTRYGSNNRYYFYNYPRKAIVSENTIQFSDYSNGSEFFKASVKYTLITMA